MNVSVFIPFLIGSAFLYSAFAPIDFAYILLSFLFAVYIYQFGIISNFEVACTSLLLILYYTLVTLTQPSYASISPLINIIFSVLSFWILNRHINNPHLAQIDVEKFKKILRLILISVTIFLMSDIFYNLKSLMDLGILHLIESEYAHYKFKKSEILSDTNSLCLMFICLFILCFQGGIFERRSTKIFIYSLLIFGIFASLSKAGIFAFCLYLIFYYTGIFQMLSRKVKLWPSLYFLSVIIVVLCMHVLETLVLGDSFTSKLYVLRLALDHFENGLWYELFFGIGLQGSLQLFDMYSHIYAVTIFVEAGILGVLLHTIWLTTLAKYAPNGFSHIMFPLLIASMSYFPLHGMAWIYLSIAGIEILTNKMNSHA